MLLARREHPHLSAGVGTGRTVCPGWVRDVVAGSIEPMDPSGMRARLLLAPWWVLALYYVVLFGGLIGVFLGIRESSVRGGVVAGLVGGLLFSAIMTPLMIRMRAQLGGQLLERTRVAQKSSWRGPLPSDPAVRADALGIAHEALRQAERFRWPGVGLFSVFLGLGIVNVAQGNHSSAWTLPMFVALVALSALWPGHMKKRVALLEQPS